MNIKSQQENDSRIKAAFSMIKIMLACIAFSTAVVSVLPWSGIINLPPSLPENSSNLVMPLAAVSLILICLGFWFRKMAINCLAEPGSNLQITARLQKMNTGFLISFIMFEAVALLGLAACLSGYGREVSAYFSISSLCCMYMAWPKENNFAMV